MDGDRAAAFCGRRLTEVVVPRISVALGVFRREKKHPVAALQMRSTILLGVIHIPSSASADFISECLAFLSTLGDKACRKAIVMTLFNPGTEWVDCRQMVLWKGEPGVSSEAKGKAD